MQKHTKFKAYGGFLRVVVSLSLLSAIAFVFRGTLSAVFSCLQNVSLPLFLASLAVFSGVVACNARRLTLFLHFHSINISYIQVFSFNLLALFVNIFVPSSISGDAVKAYRIHQMSGRQEVYGLVILDRFFGLLCLVALSSTILLFSGVADFPGNIRLTIFVLAAMTSFSVIVLLHPGIARAIDRFQSSKIPRHFSMQLSIIYTAMQLHRYPGKIVLKAFCFSLGAQCFYILNYYLISKSLDLDLPLTFFVFFVPINVLLGLAPSMNGLGVREAAYLFYATTYIGPDEALALSLLSTFTLILAGCLGGVANVVSKNHWSGADKVKFQLK
ncbi:MAG: flippase-like domain-containing protein [Proteobacteria bacterium]|nr:flippase-like domain-containing protein [Pseudomonadota bacterium]MBU1686866.1 flippase-like domain-containing protein [Pseudomonadota bacterium]